MSVRTSHPSLPCSPKTVGSVASANLLNHPFSLKESDIVEFRLDSLLPTLREVKSTLVTLKNSPLQSLITVRCQSEGGNATLNTSQRAQLIMGLCPLANFVDIELANYDSMSQAVDYAKSMNCVMVASFHDFKKTPSQDSLRDKIKAAEERGADIVKLAVYHNHVEEIFQCAQLLQEGHNIAISLMGMGPLAPTSRLLYAQLGSLLNYGYLGKSETAPGQWPAELLNQAINSTTPFR